MSTPGVGSMLRGLDLHNSSTKDVTKVSSMVWLFFLKCETITLLTKEMGGELAIK